MKKKSPKWYSLKEKAPPLDAKVWFRHLLFDGQNWAFYRGRMWGMPRIFCFRGVTDFMVMIDEKAVWSPDEPPAK